MKITAVLVHVDGDEDLKRLLHYVEINGKIAAEGMTDDNVEALPIGATVRVGEPEPPTSPTPRRRKANPLGDGDRASGSSQGETAAPPAGESSGRRRRSPQGSATTAAKSSAEGEDQSRPTEAAASTAGASSRRRVPATSAPPATTSRSDDKISDADLARAASHAAMKITPKAVMSILEQFGVEKTNDLKPEVRREFLDQVEDAVAKSQ